MPTAQHFCTYFDRNYLTRGLALYQSLQEHCAHPFVLWILCFDDESYDILSRLKLAAVRLIRRSEFEAGDRELATARGNRSAVEYYWTCTPSLPLYILGLDGSIDLITYLDADLFFYSDPQPIFDEFGEGSILIHGHRYAPEHAHFARTSGIYNVGLLSFRRDEAGLECLKWWRDRCNGWCYARFEDGKYGDQKYLDDWPQRFSGVVVLKHPGAGLAVWNISQYQIEQVGKDVRLNGSSLIFFHFHALKVIASYAVAPSGSSYKYDYSRVSGIFVAYAGALRKAAAISGLSVVDQIPVNSAINTVRRVLNQEILFTGNTVLLKMFWTIGRRRRFARDCIFLASGSVREGDKHDVNRLIIESLIANPVIVLERIFWSVAMRYIFGNRIIDELKQSMIRLKIFC